MSTYLLFLHIVAAIALAGVVCRLFSMKKTGNKVFWHVWIIAHVLVGIGLAAKLFHADWSDLFVLSGLCVYFGSRWYKGSSGD